MNNAIPHPNRIQQFLAPEDVKTIRPPAPSTGALPPTPQPPQPPRPAASPLRPAQDAAAPALSVKEQAWLEKIAQAEESLAMSCQVLTGLEWRRPLTLTAAEAEPLAEGLAHMVTAIIEDLAEAAAEALEPPVEPEPLPADPVKREREEERER